jgi:hypothetical protein
MKAELFSTDFMVSILIFLSALVMITFFYQNMHSDMAESQARNDMYSKAISLASMLATTSGYPTYWNNSSVKNIGIYDGGKFNLTKFDEMKKVDVQLARIMFGTSYYNFYISMKNETGGVMGNYSYGNPIVNPEQVIVIKRLGVTVFNGTARKAILEVDIWL